MGLARRVKGHSPSAPRREGPHWANADASGVEGVKHLLRGLAGQKLDVVRRESDVDVELPQQRLAQRHRLGEPLPDGTGAAALGNAVAAKHLPDLRVA